MTRTQLHDYCRDCGVRASEQHAHFERSMWNAVAFAVMAGDPLETVRTQLIETAERLEMGGPCHLRNYCAPVYRSVAARLPMVTLTD